MSTTIPVPLTPPYQKISDRKINVCMKIGGRQDLLAPAPGAPPTITYSRISGWLRDAYISVAYSRTFEQAEFSYTFQTAVGQDTYAIPNTCRAPKAITGYDTNGSPIIVNWTSIAYLRRLSIQTTAASGTRPSYYTLWNNNIILGPKPQGQYTFIFDYWQKPLITPDVDSTPLLIPDDWLEIIDYQAAVRGNAELQQADKSREIQEMLFGFTEPTTGRVVPGLVEELQNRQMAMTPYTDWGIQPQGSQGYTK